MSDDLDELPITSDNFVVAEAGRAQAHGRLCDGLDVIEQLGRWANDEALGLTREADAIERTLVEPVKPVEPEGYRPSLELAAAVDQLHAL